MKRLFDISPLISEKTAVFPGDQPFSRKIAMDFAQGDHLTLSSITTTLHIGAHADAPHHYHSDGENIEERSLERYLGPAQVIHIQKNRGERILPEDLKTTINAPRILFATNSFPDPNQWNDDFNSLSPELIEHLHQKGVILVGIDTPSIDPADSKTLESHQAIYRCDMSILEGLVLKDVPDGLYKLIALPLKLEGADASPVRAVLLNDDILNKSDEVF